MPELKNLSTNLSIMGHGVIASSQAQLMVDPKSIMSQAVGIPPNRSPIQSVQLPTVRSQDILPRRGIFSFQLHLLLWSWICWSMASSATWVSMARWQRFHVIGSVSWCSKKHLQRKQDAKKNTNKMHKYHHQYKQYAYVYIHTAFSRFSPYLANSWQSWNNATLIGFLHWPLKFLQTKKTPWKTIWN